jgi:hypothetical protein
LLAPQPTPCGVLAFPAPLVCSPAEPLAEMLPDYDGDNGRDEADPRR